MSTIKVVFLDIDGVLNSIRSAIALQGYGSPVMNKRDATDQDWKDAAKLDPIAVGILARLLNEHEDLRVVISSTWRIMAPLGAFEKILTVYGCPAGRVIGRTQELPGIRGIEINAWLHDPMEEVSQYAILDDNSDMLAEQRTNFVQTDPDVGLGYREYLMVTDVLKTTKAQAA